jgi:hypothetical protein
VEFEWHSFLSSFQHPLDLLVVLIFGHFVADYPLQGDKMAVEKCPGSDVTINWKWWLTAHTATHGFMVAILTGIPLLGLAEMAAHFCIDFGKCRIGYPLLVDQALHCFCKVLWVIFIMLMV